MYSVVCILRIIQHGAIKSLPSCNYFIYVMVRSTYEGGWFWRFTCPIGMKNPGKGVSFWEKEVHKKFKNYIFCISIFVFNPLILFLNPLPPSKQCKLVCQLCQTDDWVILPSPKNVVWDNAHTYLAAAHNRDILDICNFQLARTFMQLYTSLSAGELPMT